MIAENSRLAKFDNAMEQVTKNLRDTFTENEELGRQNRYLDAANKVVKESAEREINLSWNLTAISWFITLVLLALRLLGW